MSDRIEDLRRLADLLDDGKISEGEYDTLKTEIIEPSTEGLPALKEAIHAARGTSNDAEEVGSAHPDWLINLQSTEKVFVVALAAGILAAVGGWLLWPLPWLAIVLGSLALVATDERHNRWMAWMAIASGALFAAIGLANEPGIEIGTVNEPPPQVTTFTEELSGSLGVRFDELAGQWNAAEQPPFITSQVRATPETGQLDSFLYRFDDSAVVAGAYDPDTQHIYALLARAGLHHDEVSNMYVHLCHLLHPGSQGCLDAFVEKNDMFGVSPMDFVDVEYDQIWAYGGNEWRLTIEANIQTIRVQAPELPG